MVIFSYSPSGTLGAPSESGSASNTNGTLPAAPPGVAGIPSPPVATAAAPAGKSGSSSDSANLPPILGGVFGAVAGVGLVLWVLLFLLRHRKRQLKGYNGGGQPILRDSNGASDRGAPPTSEEPQAKKQEMASLLSFGAISELFGKSKAENKPHRGPSFVKVSGRKLPSALGPDVDKTPFGEGPADDNMVPGGALGAERSVSLDDDGTLSGRGLARSGPQGSLNLHSSINEDEPGIAAFRSSFATSEPGEGGSRFPTPPPPSRITRLQGSSTADGVGRSLPSQDGSKTSRFTEDV